jgi:hypothetical protein
MRGGGVKKKNSRSSKSKSAKKSGKDSSNRTKRTTVEGWIFDASNSRLSAAEDPVLSKVFSEIKRHHMQEDFLVAKLRPSCQVCKAFLHAGMHWLWGSHYDATGERVWMCSGCMELQRAAPSDAERLVSLANLSTAFVLAPVNPRLPEATSTIPCRVPDTLEKPSGWFPSVPLPKEGDTVTFPLPDSSALAWPVSRTPTAADIASLPRDVEQEVRLAQPIIDPDPGIDCEVINVRQTFLNLCQGNHYQFDQLRRAKHSTQMILYHLHNPSQPAFVHTCNVCSQPIASGFRYYCAECPDLDLCEGCKATVSHPHPLVPVAASASAMLDRGGAAAASSSSASRPSPPRKTHHSRTVRQAAIVVRLLLGDSEAELRSFKDATAAVMSLVKAGVPPSLLSLSSATPKDLESDLAEAKAVLGSFAKAPVRLTGSFRARRSLRVLRHIAYLFTAVDDSTAAVMTKGLAPPPSAKHVDPLAPVKTSHLRAQSETESITRFKAFIAGTGGTPNPLMALVSLDDESILSEPIAQPLAVNPPAELALVSSAASAAVLSSTEGVQQAFKVILANASKRIPPTLAKVLPVVQAMVESIVRDRYMLSRTALVTRAQFSHAQAVHEGGEKLLADVRALRDLKTQYEAHKRQVQDYTDRRKERELLVQRDKNAIGATLVVNITNRNAYGVPTQARLRGIRDEFHRVIEFERDRYLYELARHAQMIVASQSARSIQPGVVATKFVPGQAPVRPPPSAALSGSQMQAYGATFDEWAEKGKDPAHFPNREMLRQVTQKTKEKYQLWLGQFDKPVRNAHIKATVVRLIEAHREQYLRHQEAATAKAAPAAIVGQRLPSTHSAVVPKALPATDASASSSASQLARALLVAKAGGSTPPESAPVAAVAEENGETGAMRSQKMKLLLEAFNRAVKRPASTGPESAAKRTRVDGEEEE